MSFKAWIILTLILVSLAGLCENTLNLKGVCVFSPCFKLHISLNQWLHIWENLYNGAYGLCAWVMLWHQIWVPSGVACGTCHLISFILKIKCHVLINSKLKFNKKRWHFVKRKQGTRQSQPQYHHQAGSCTVPHCFVFMLPSRSSVFTRHPKPNNSNSK